MSATTIGWSSDHKNNTLEGRVDGELLYDIEIGNDGVILYQLKEHVGNYKEFPSVDEAKKFCIKKHFQNT